MLKSQGLKLKLEDFLDKPSKRADRLNILFIARLVGGEASTIRDHCRSFEAYSRHSYVYVNIFKANASDLIELDAFDCIVIHYSVYSLSQTFLHPTWIAAIARSKAFKIMFIQDEYRLVNAFSAKMRELRIDALFTCVPYDEIEKAYPESSLPNVHKISNLTGYVPEGLELCEPLDSARRPVDVGYRGRDLDYWLGELGQEKSLIARGFLRHALPAGLACDISCKEEDRIYGHRWLEFLKSCRCVLGTESGASVFDFTGGIEADVRAFLNGKPDAAFREAQELFFKDKEGLITLNQISPRVFESVACGCCLVMFEGEYSGVVKPDLHFIPLKKDFSNIEDVLAKVKDREYVSAMARRAYQDVIVPGKYSYKSFVVSFDNILDHLLAGKAPVGAGEPELKPLAFALSKSQSAFLASAVYRELRLSLGQLYRATLARNWRALSIPQFQIFFLLGAMKAIALSSSYRRSAKTSEAGCASEAAAQGSVDDGNASFWNELCGTSNARGLGIVDFSKESLQRYDDWYMGYYPYLCGCIPFAELQGKDVLEIGLGYGTVAQRLMESKANYRGLDISKGPVEMVNSRAGLLGLPAPAIQGSILDAPFPESSFDCVIAIGCLHHTGNLEKALAECHRLLRPGGTLVFMVYYAYSYRRWLTSPLRTGVHLLHELLGRRGVANDGAAARALYDSNAKGEAAPHTDWISEKSLRRLCKDFSSFSSRLENIDPADFPFYMMPSRSRAELLAGPGRRFGLDIYVAAVK